MKFLPALIALILCPLLFAQERADDPMVSDPPATLEVWNREITTLRATIAGLTPAERRDEIIKRMRDLPDFSRYKPATRRKVSAGDLHGVSFEIDGRRLFVLIDADLDPTSDESLDAHADEVLARIEALRQAWLDQRSAGVILRGVGIAVLDTAVFALVLYLLRRLGLFLRRLFVQRAARLGKLKRRDLDLRPVILILVRRIVGLIIALLGFSVAYLWITHVLGCFPFTSPWSEVLGEKLVALAEKFGTGFLGALPGLVVVVLIFFVTRGTARIVDQLLTSLEQSEDEGEVLGKDTARATRRIAVLTVWIAGVIIAYPYIPGSDSPAFKGIGVLLGLMVSLGSSGFVGQLMSGFVVLYSGAVRSGEFVRVGDIEGTVTEIGLLSTKIRTAKREYVSVPNGVIVARETRNYSRRGDEDSARCEFSTSVSIGYDTPWRQVHELLLDAANRTPGIRKDPKPRVLQTALSDFCVDYELRFVPAEPERRGGILSDLHQRIQDAFHDAGIQIMSPHFEGQPDNPVLPPDRPVSAPRPSDPRD